MTDTALYYTFSTIAQALAGAFGVLAAFAILAWTRIEADIHDGQAAMFDLKNPGSDALWDYCRLIAAWVPTAIDIGLSIVLIPFIVFALVCLGFYGAVVLVTIPRETW